MTDGATEKVGATETLTDEIAEDHVDHMIELVTALPPDIRPSQQLVAGAMVELTAVVDELRELRALIRSMSSSGAIPLPNTVSASAYLATAPSGFRASAASRWRRRASLILLCLPTGDLTSP